MVTIIAAIGLNNALGKNNDLIWHLPSDLKRFKKTTTGFPIIMGRKTFESIGKPLPNRTNVIVTRNPSYTKDGCEVVTSLKEAIDIVSDQEKSFIIGGAQIYQQAIEENLVDELDITLVQEEFEADVFFPEFDKLDWELISRQDFEKDEKNPHDYSFLKFKKVS
ncbi:MAG: diacylglycerol kinase [Flavobacteriaceae bacterium]|nr:diacylglycerol kinase [Flavobacteriaceae bacterium]|tara:strand:- start:7165 stop:7656 length:492 start_codon:yes stop_codon:yes gene_type:complete